MARKIPLNTIPLMPENDDESLDYREMFINILRTPTDPRAGVNYDEMLKRTTMIKKVREAKKVLLLEEAEWSELCAAFKAYRFARVFESIVQMGDDILNAEKIKLEEVKA